MSKKKSGGVSDKSGSYSHDQQAVQRPDVGVQPEFDARKPPTQYRYDSLLAPELCWDENAERDMAEQSAGFALDVHPGVVRWVKNEHLGLFIPYRKTGGVPARYIPDFIATLDIELNLIIETKGQYNDAADIKAKAAQRWVNAINQDGNYGLWAYEVVKDPTGLPLVIDKYSAAKWDSNANLELSQA